MFPFLITASRLPLAVDFRDELLHLFFLFVITVQRSFVAFCLFASAMATPTGSNLALQAVSEGTHLFSTNFVKVLIEFKYS